jgi:hypothetical protein
MWLIVQKRISPWQNIVDLIKFYNFYLLATLLIWLIFNEIWGKLFPILYSVILVSVICLCSSGFVSAINEHQLQWDIQTSKEYI